MQLKNLNITKKGINTMSGIYLFNVGRIKNLEVNGSGSKFVYKENRNDVQWEVSDTLASINKELELYTSGSSISVTVDYYNLAKRDSTMQLSIDSILYAWADPTNPSKTRVIYVGDSALPDQLIISKNYSAFMILANTDADISEDKSLTMTQNLTAGDNTVSHGKGTIYGWTVKDVIVWDGNDLSATEISIIDTDNINVILAGGSITGARIEIEFK